MRRYLGLLGMQLRMSLTLGAQYRADFVLEGAVGLIYVFVSLVPLLVAFRDRPSVEGWSLHEAMVVMGAFTVLQALLWGAINPSLVTIGEHVRKGTLDFVLLKPADAQFLISTAKFQVWQLVPALGGVGLIGYAFAALGRSPSAAQVGLALLLLGAALLVLYSICIVAASAAFWVVRLDNLAYLLSSVFDAARWPIDVFQGLLRFLFTFVIPLALMTTYPAEALLGRLSATTALGAFAGAGIFAALARRIWVSALGRYTSASS